MVEKETLTLKPFLFSVLDLDDSVPFMFKIPTINMFMPAELNFLYREKVVKLKVYASLS